MSRAAGRQADAVRLANTVRGEFPQAIPIAFNIVVTRAEVCENRRGMCRKPMDDYLDAILRMHQHPMESLAILAKKMPNVDSGVLAGAFGLAARWTLKATKISMKGLADA